MLTTIQEVHARQVLDSRGNPTVEVDVRLANGIIGRAMVPSGASTGTHEAVELRDGPDSPYAGKSVGRAIENVNRIISPQLGGMSVLNQLELDEKLIQLDGTPNKGQLGANAILGVSLAAARAGAKQSKLPLYRYLNQLYDDTHSTPCTLPMPMVNIISGGLHAGGLLDIQDFLAIPLGAANYTEALVMIANVRRQTYEVLSKLGYEAALVADEGGFGPRLQSNEQALSILVEAIAQCGYEAGADIAIGVDVAASHFFSDGRYQLQREAQSYSADEWIDIMARWSHEYPIVSIEDPLHEDDWSGWRKITERLGECIQLLGDDLFTTSSQRLQRGISEQVGNAILIKVNQVGTLSETFDAIRIAKRANYNTIVSARSGETEDHFIADLAVATNAGQIKIGSITRSERLAKYNQLLRIEEALGIERFTGAATLGWKLN